MKRLTLTASFALAVAVPGVAQAQLTHSQTTAYGKAYVHVVKAFGWKAAGCRLIGPQATCHVAHPSDGTILQSTDVLHRMLAPAPAPATYYHSVYHAYHSTYHSPSSTAGLSYSYAGGKLASIRACESGGNYSTNTGNGFYGAYQFTQSTWESVGGSGNPADASPAEQDMRAAKLYAGGAGAGNWPVCAYR